MNHDAFLGRNLAKFRFVRTTSLPFLLLLRLSYFKATYLTVGYSNQARHSLDGDGRRADHEAVTLGIGPAFELGHDFRIRNDPGRFFRPAWQQHEGPQREVDQLQFRQHDRKQVEDKLVVDRNVLVRVGRLAGPSRDVVNEGRESQQDVDPERGQAEGDVPSQQVAAAAAVAPVTPKPDFRWLTVPVQQPEVEVRQGRDGQQADGRHVADGPPEADLPDLRRLVVAVKVLPQVP